MLTESVLKAKKKMIPGPRHLMPQKILSSWKEIASYLGHSRRTVQRWERELSLPIHRPAGRESHSVMAFNAQLDNWLQSFTQNSVSSNSGRTTSYMESSVLASGNESLTKLERLLLEEDTLFQQLQEKRAEIRSEKAQMQNGKNIEPMQGRAAVMS
jgi:predicted DNA-binding transcriptional regulator AlpA